MHHHEQIQQPVPAAAAVLLAHARRAYQRRALLLAGDRDWAVRQADAILREIGLAAGAGWLGDRAPAGIEPVRPSRVSVLLGRELPALVIDAYAGFDPDAVGAALGALAGGGLLLLLTPPLDRWPDYPDPEHARIVVAPYPATAVTGRFLRRLAAVLADSADIHRIEQGRPLPPLADEPPAAPPRPAPPYASDDQRQAVAAVVRVATGRRRRPLLLVADRGRGKSAAFGIAAAELLRGGRRILLTGPRLDAVQAVFDHAGRLTPGAVRQPDALETEHGWLRFMAPDALAAALPEADLVLVDEAAALPVPLLLRLLDGYPRIAFASTVHGYEGTGRGFALRFQTALAARAPAHRLLRLTTPVRWTTGDPVERLGFRLLLLDAEPAADAAVAGAAAADLRVERLDRDAIAADEPLLAELFGLLLQAHYRTRPFDLRHLLDGPNVELHVLRRGRDVAAAALVALEGGLDPAMSEPVLRGERRLRGHLIPQSLAFHLGLPDALRLRCARIMRLAVHPACRRRGLGSRLLAAVAADAAARGLQLVGSSFGGSSGLLAFWQYCGFRPVRVGLTREATSGEHALLMLRPLGRSAEPLFQEARRRFLRDLPDQLLEPLRDLAPDLALALLAEADPAGRALDDADRAALAAFAFAHRGYGDTIGPLRRLVLDAAARQPAGKRLCSEGAELLAAKVLQGRDWTELARTAGLGGRADIVQALRDAVAVLLGASAGG